MDYPQFRKLEGAPNLYAIEGPKHVTEWQPLGTGKWVVHQHYASDYPRYQWVTELLQGDEPVCTLTVDGWHRLLSEREVVSEETAPGRTPGAPVQASWKDEAAVGPLTTFGATAHAHCLAEVATDAEVRWALQDRAALPLMVLADGTRLTLGDVARVDDGFAETDNAARFDGMPAVMVQVFRVGDQSAIEIADE